MAVPGYSRWSNRENCGYFRLLVDLRRCQDQVQRVAFLAGPKFNDALISNVFDQAVKDLAAKHLARHFASTEENGRLYLVTLVEEPKHVVLLRLVIVLVHIDAELHFLDDDLLLVLLVLAVLLFLLIEELAVIHDAADRRLSRR